jgi:hypothetical protein
MMQKKIVLALLLAAFVAGGAFSQQFTMSAGGGALFDFSGNNGIKEETTYPSNYYDSKLRGKTESAYLGHRSTSFGAFGFFDVTYVELGLYFAFGSMKGVAVLGDEDKEVSDDSESMVQFGFSILGKYPINMGDFTLFPLLGIDYNRVLSVGGETEKIGEYYSQFGFLAGLGGDIKLSGPLFIRLEGLLHLRLPAKLYKELKDAGDVLSKANEALGGPKTSTSTTLGFGPQIKVALGYKF